MTICTGCGIETEASICCPICLKYEKNIFYCSQECYEQNYQEHKKIHYFITKATHDDIYNKIQECNEKDRRGGLPILVLNGEDTQNNKMENQNELTNGGDVNAKNNAYEHKNRKRNVHAYNVIGDEFERYEESKEPVNEREKDRFKNGRNAPFVSNMLDLVFPSRSNLELPYYENDKDINQDSKGRERKLRTKLNSKQYKEMKQQMRAKRIIHLIILAFFIIIIVIGSTYLFSTLIEQTYSKNINLMNRKTKESTILLEERQSIKEIEIVIEEMRKEMEEMKEILYIHNTLMHKHFNTSTSFNLFNNLTKKKGHINQGKKGEERFNLLSTHTFYKDPEEEEEDMETNTENEAVLKQIRYDISDIKERAILNENREEPSRNEEYTVLAQEEEKEEEVERKEKEPKEKEVVKEEVEEFKEVNEMEENNKEDKEMEENNKEDKEKEGEQQVKKEIIEEEKEMEEIKREVHTFQINDNSNEHETAVLNEHIVQQEEDESYENKENKKSKENVDNYIKTHSSIKEFNSPDVINSTPNEEKVIEKIDLTDNTNREKATSSSRNKTIKYQPKAIVETSNDIASSNEVDSMKNNRKRGNDNNDVSERKSTPIIKNKKKQQPL